MQQTVVPQQRQGGAIPDLDPFAIDPLILGPLYRRGLRRSTVAITAAVLIAGSVIASAAVEGLLMREGTSSALGDLQAFLFRGGYAGGGGPVPYLRDYPSIVLTGTIAAAVALVYSLFAGSATLHSSLDKSGCVEEHPRARALLTGQILVANERMRRAGRFWPVALVGSLATTAATTWLMRGGLFGFLDTGLYGRWWASVHPFRIGSLVWILVGALGVYLVYAQSILGVTYVRFLRGLHKAERADSDRRPHFRANVLSLDGFFGWQALRRLVTNMQAGAVLSLMSAWAISFFMQPAFGGIVTLVVVVLYLALVAYVYLGVSSHVRIQVQESRQREAEAAAQVITTNTDGSDPASLLRALVAYRRLEFVSRVPDSPLRQRWLWAAAVTALGPLIAIVDLVGTVL